MARGRPKQQIVLSESEKRDLTAMSLNSKPTKALRAKVVLLSAEGIENKTISERLGFNESTVAKWRKRYISSGMCGLLDQPRSGRRSRPVTLRKDEMEVLSQWGQSRSLPHSLVQRAKIILMLSENLSYADICKNLSISSSTVRKWKKNFLEYRIEGLHDDYRSGRPRTYEEEQVAELMKKTLETKPEGETHWSTRSMESETGISRSTVSRIWRLFGTKPHKQGHFKISNDPFFIEKVVDVIGLYLSPPENALVLCVDEKSQCQALERAQPILPMGLGYAESVTDNYIRHGTTTLFAALDVATGHVEVACKSKHRHQEFIQFLNQLERNTPKDLEIHVILDNYGTHKHEKVKAWLLRHPRFHFHFVPTYSSWLNQVERWFGIITDKAIRRGSFNKVSQLIEKINEFTSKYNKNSKPFIWTATAEEIFEKLGRLCRRIHESRGNSN